MWSKMSSISYMIKRLNCLTCKLFRVSQEKMGKTQDSKAYSDPAGVHFVLRGKNAGNFELLSFISKSDAMVVSVPGGGTILCSSLYDLCCSLSYKFQE